MSQSVVRVPFDRDFKAIRLFPDIEDALYLDVGGNRGFAADAILMSQKRAKVIAFEPNPHMYYDIQDRFKDCSRVEVYNFGLGDEEGQFTLNVPVYRDFVFDGLASLDANHATQWLRNDSLCFYNDKYLEVREYNCTLKRLDDLGLCPFFIKIDVQGHELPVLKGGEKTISTFRPILLVESVIKGDALTAYMGRLGYKVYRYDGGGYSFATKLAGQIPT